MSAHVCYTLGYQYVGSRWARAQAGKRACLSPNVVPCTRALAAPCTTPGHRVSWVLVRCARCAVFAHACCSRCVPLPAVAVRAGSVDVAAVGQVRSKQASCAVCDRTRSRKPTPAFQGTHCVVVVVLCMLSCGVCCCVRRAALPVMSKQLSLTETIMRSVTH